MTRLTRTFLATAALVAGVAIVQAAATDPDVLARQALMKTIGGSVKALGDLSKGTTPYDAATAEAAKAALVAAALDIDAKYMTQTADPEQKTKQEVWTNWADFQMKSKALADAAAALDVSSAEAIGAGIPAIGSTCQACHSAYRL